MRCCVTLTRSNHLRVSEFSEGKGHHVQKILVVTKNWLGDILFQLPAIERIRSHYPEAEIVCLAPGRCRPLLESFPAVDRVIEFDEKTTQRSLISRLALLFALRRETWDKAFLLHGSRTRAMFVRAAGARERIGYETDRRFFLTTGVPEPEEPLHQVDYFLRLLEVYGLRGEEKGRYRYPVSGEVEKNIRKRLQQEGLEKGRFAAFHLGANWEPKRWPPAYFAELADLLSERAGLPVIVTGASRDLPLGKAMMSRVRKADVRSWIGTTTLEDLAALFQNAGFVVSADSGPMHIASGAGAPVMALFGPTHPALTGPRGEGPVRVIHEIPEGFYAPWFGPGLPEGGWMERIQPRRVFEELEKAGWLKGVSSAKENCRTESALQGLNPDFVRSRRARDILVVSLSNIGDVVLTTPVIKLLRRLYPSACMTVVTGPKAVTLLEGSGDVDRLVIYDKHASLPGQIRFLRTLQGVRYDVVVDLRNTAIPFLVRAGRRSPLFRTFREVSMRARHLEVLRMMRLPYQIQESFDFGGRREELSVQELLVERGVRSRIGWIVVAPVAASQAKTWPLEGFRAVLRALLKDSERDILLCGDAEEQRIMEPLTTLNPARIFNLAGRTSLRELAVMIRLSDLVLANDSACMHLGYEQERPVVALFGPTDPEKYGRRGSRYRLIHEPHSFRELDPDRVVQACRELLAVKTAAVQGRA